MLYTFSTLRNAIGGGRSAIGRKTYRFSKLDADTEGRMEEFRGGGAGAIVGTAGAALVGTGGTDL